MTTIERVGVAPIVQKMVKILLRWFGHVDKRFVNSIVMRVDLTESRVKSLEAEEDLEKL